ncbi:hypothetical protein ACSZM8_01195 [Aeromonas caviae]
MLTLTMTDRFQRVRTLAPGMAVSITVAAAATFLSEHYGAPCCCSPCCSAWG